VSKLDSALHAFGAASRRFSRLAGRLGPRVKTLLAYAGAAAIIWLVSRGIPLAAMANTVRRADLGLFLSATAGILLVWLLGETLLFSRLFTYFHRPTSFGETLVPNAVQYFLQLVNVAVSHGAMIYLLGRRKGVPLLTAGCTMLFQGFVDLQVLLLMALAGLALAPSFPAKGAAWYLIAALAGLWLASWLWMRGRPASAWARYLYDLPALSTFRRARPWHYLRLVALRTPIFALQGVALYLQMLAFHIRAPFGLVVALTPVIMLITSIPLTPVGLGSEQAAILLCFHSFAARADLVTFSLAISLTNVIFRMALGAGFVKPLLRSLREEHPAEVGGLEGLSSGRLPVSSPLELTGLPAGDFSSLPRIQSPERPGLLIPRDSGSDERGFR
jgi:Lysylphosphatidylglycerol synthase TM region